MKRDFSHTPGNTASSRRHLFFGCLIATLLLGGCSSYRSFDSLSQSEPIPVSGMAEAASSESGKLTAHYDQLHRELERVAPPPPVDVQPVSPKYDPLEDKIVTINMYDTDIGKLLWTLADQLGMNLIVDPQVLEHPKKTSLYLKDVTAREVYNHILEAFDLHGEVRSGALLISMMEERLFNAGLLSSHLSINLAAGGDVFGSNSSSSTSGSMTGNGDSLRADFSINGNTSKQMDPYDEIENGVKRILGEAAARPEPEQPLLMKRTAANAALGQGDILLPPVAAAYSLNRMSGALYVKARPSQVRAIGKLVERNKTVLRRQVQVEAQLIDVQLNDGFQFGVDWTLLRNHVAGIYGANPLHLSEGTSIFPGGSLADRVIRIPQQIIGTAPGQSGMGLMYGDDTFSATLKALSSFGNLRVLSNPSVRVRNGTPALLSVGTSVRYISKTTSTTNVPGGGASTTTADVETDALFSGIVIGVVPFVHDNARIELLVHPMQTEVVPESLRLVEVGGGNYVTLPMIHYKGLTTTLNLGNGDTVLIGGLIDQNKTIDTNGIPGLSEIPLVGNIFGEQNSKHKSRELVMVLRVRTL